MSMPTQRIVVRVVLMFALALPVAAGAADKPRDYSAVPMPFVNNLQQRTSREAFIAATFSPFRQFDKNGDGLVATELEQSEVIERAQQRATNLAALYAFDLNGDGRIERAEIERANAHPPGPGGVIHERPTYVDKRAGEVMKADRNRDGAIDFEEARNQRPAQPGYGSRGGRELLGLDPNKDGRLTARELETLARNAFDTVDIDGNGTLSHRERRLFEEATRTAYIAHQNTANRSCGMTKPAAAHRFVVVAPLLVGEAVSSVALAGQDQETTVAVLDIEPGAQPLHILIVSWSTRIWQFRGATSRVAHVALAANQPAAVAGLAQEKVTLLPTGDCNLHVSSAPGAALNVARMLRATVGREPDVVLMEPAPGTIALPSGKIVARKTTPLNPANRGDAWLMTFRGEQRPEVIEIDPKTIVAADPVERYDVLPNEAGLYQLLNEGALVYTGNRTFKIVKPIKRYPAGLGGGRAVTFVLAKGVPQPPGRPGHSCLRSETGVPVNFPGGSSYLCR